MHNAVTEKNNAQRMAEQLATILQQNQQQHRQDGWFLTQEIRMKALQQIRSEGVVLSRPLLHAKLFAAVCRELPITIREGEIFAGTQSDSFARTYALINPEFKVETFAGYCDPMAVYGDITPAPELGFTSERIASVRDFWAEEEFARALAEVYKDTGAELQEVAYFVEQVTGHTVADFRPALASGLLPLIAKAKRKAKTGDEEQVEFYQAAIMAMNATLQLADRYADLAKRKADNETDPLRKSDLLRIAETCPQVLRNGANNLYEAIQAFIILWMAMTLEQAPNPYAFSVGNLDRILQPYYQNDSITSEEAIEMTRHLLAFFCVGDRNWAISQNIMVGGRDSSSDKQNFNTDSRGKARDLTCDMSGVVLEAFFRSNSPQPALSVKLHSTTPDEFYQMLEPFFTTPGSVTPSLFNDDRLYELLQEKGIEKKDCPDYSIAGCQEPLIMGKESGNTTNSWLNLAKVLEVTLHDGKSALSGKTIGLNFQQLGLDPQAPLADPKKLRRAFYQQLDHLLQGMERAANGCTTALSLLPVPFLSVFMGGLESGRDMRDTNAQGTRYNASGCLIHGLSVVADSFAALEMLAAEDAHALADLPAVLLHDFDNDNDLRERLLAAPKYGNDLPVVDNIATEIAREVSLRILELRNPWGNQFLPDWSTPSTHLLYGYWVGATPDGRHSRASLGYGIDPTPGMATHGLPPRIMSMLELPYQLFLGGYASHIGLDRQMMEGFKCRGFIGALRNYLLDPLFGYNCSTPGGFYTYLNIDTANHLRKILDNPRKMVPSGIYIMRIHGTFVNFLDLSPAIQQDIIERLDPASTTFGTTV